MAGFDAALGPLGEQPLGGAPRRARKCPLCPSSANARETVNILNPRWRAISRTAGMRSSGRSTPS